MSQKLLFVFNPRSGKGQIKNKLMEIVDIMVKAGYEVNIHPTQDTKDAQKLVEKEAGAYDLVVCCGGDGTLDEVVTGMMARKEKVPIGYIPAGSTNDFANSLQIPKEMTEAAQVAVCGKKYLCDVGSFNGDSFVYVAAFGLFTDVSYETSQEMKNLLGHVAYILEGAKRLHSITSYKMRVEYEDQVIEDEFIYGMVTNSTSVGGFRSIVGDDVELDDGVFEVTLIKKPRNPVDLNRIIACLTNITNETEFIYSFKTAQVNFYMQEEIPWTLDGEFGGNHKQVEVKNMQKAMEIMRKSS
ncbi:MAG: diacylglycerol/lipid kinase family protein [Lachnospiraceae bacterium]